MNFAPDEDAFMQLLKTAMCRHPSRIEDMWSEWLDEHMESLWPQFVDEAAYEERAGLMCELSTELGLDAI